MSEQQLTLKDWETLYNMVVASQQREKELEEKISQLEAKLSQVQAIIPKTGLLSHSMLTRMVTVFFYVLVSYFVISLLVGFMPYLLTYWWVALIVIVIVAIIKWIVKLTTYPIEDSVVSGMAMRYNGLKR